MDVLQKATAFADARVEVLQNANKDAMWHAAWNAAQDVLIAGKANKNIWI